MRKFNKLRPTNDNNEIKNYLKQSREGFFKNIDLTLSEMKEMKKELKKLAYKIHELAFLFFEFFILIEYTKNNLS